VQNLVFLASNFANLWPSELEVPNEKIFKILLVRNFQLKKIDLAKLLGSKALGPLGRAFRIF
jgi:hypothetical protein